MSAKPYSTTAKQRRSSSSGARTLASVTAEMNDIGNQIATMATRGQAGTAEYRRLVSDLERIMRERAVLAWRR